MVITCAICLPDGWFSVGVGREREVAPMIPPIESSKRAEPQDTRRGAPVEFSTLTGGCQMTGRFLGRA